ncbi:MAG: ABC transporter permease, partial [Bacteroidales bacterium]|nr:ABC transporter permease [Bacteroidales bacterium]
MFRNFFVITFRNLIRNRSFSLLSILGLTTGLAVFSAIALYIQHEFSYEKNHENLDRLYRVEQFRKDKDVIQNLCGTPPPLSIAIVADIPQIERSTPFILNNWNTITTPDQRKIRESNVGYAGADFFEMFSVKRIAGDPDGGFTKPFMAAITQEMANKYFGDENPIGKTLRVGRNLDIEIRTVVENIPDITHLKFNILISFPTLRERYGDEVVTNDWYSNWVRNYVMVAENADISSLNQKLKNYLKKYQGDKRDNELYLKPLSKIHLYSTVIDETAQTGDIKNIYIYFAIGIFIIIIACINFINLTTAFSSDRAKEIAVKKTTGASKKLLLSQFLGESIIISLISMHLSLILLEAFLPYFN